MTCPLHIAATAALAGLSMGAALGRRLARSAGSTSKGGPTPARRPAGSFTGAKATDGRSRGMAPEPATAAARSSKRTPADGLWTDALSAGPSPGTREAFLELIAGMARVLDFEQVSMAHDPLIVRECDALRDCLLDSIDEVRKAVRDAR